MAVLTLFLMQIFLFKDPSTDHLIRAAMQANYDLRLAESRKMASSLQVMYPDHPVGYILAAESYWWEAQADPTNTNLTKAYYAAQKLAVEKGEAALKSDKYAKVELLAYLASSYGSFARFQVTQKSAYFSALGAGIKAVRYAHQVYEIDPEYYDVYTGLGAYNYFTATMPAVIKPFAFVIGVHGQKELGFQQLRTAMEKSRHSRTEAKIVYYSTLLEEKRYAEAFEVLHELMNEFYGNFVFYDWAASLFEAEHKLKEGIEYFEVLARDQEKRSSTLTKHALLQKASLEHAVGDEGSARITLERIKVIPGTDRFIQSEIAALQGRIH